MLLSQVSTLPSTFCSFLFLNMSCGMEYSFWPIQVRCPSCVPYQLCTTSYSLWRQVGKKYLSAVKALLSNSQNTDVYYQPSFSHKSKLQQHMVCCISNSIQARPITGGLGLSFCFKSCFRNASSWYTVQ